MKLKCYECCGGNRAELSEEPSDPATKAKLNGN